ncbi:MAG: 2-oxoacid:acceptor oxidoreductase family protein, partial [Candidatus Heimdallarchaeaceae archaeon]
MLEIRFHGRGGTGTVIASRALAKAVFYAGKHAVTFPSFGAERRGAPVLAFARIDDEKITKRTQIYEPDVVVVLDDSLLELTDVAKGLKEGGMCVLNTLSDPENIQLSKSVKAGVVDATRIAKEEIGLAITNSAMLGALVRSTGIVSLEDLEKGIMSVFGEKLGEEAAKRNVNA